MAHDSEIERCRSYFEAGGLLPSNFDQNSESSQGVSTAESAVESGSCLWHPGASYAVEQQVASPESESPIVRRRRQRRIIESDSEESESSTKAGGWLSRKSDAVLLGGGKPESKSGGENQTPAMC